MIFYVLKRWSIFHYTEDKDEILQNLIIKVHSTCYSKGGFSGVAISKRDSFSSMGVKVAF